MGRSFAYQIWSESFGKIATSRNRVVITNKFCLQASFLACISSLYHDHFRLLIKSEERKPAQVLLGVLVDFSDKQSGGSSHVFCTAFEMGWLANSILDFLMYSRC